MPFSIKYLIITSAKVAVYNKYAILNGEKVGIPVKEVEKEKRLSIMIKLQHAR